MELVSISFLMWHLLLILMKNLFILLRSTADARGELHFKVTLVSKKDHGNIIGKYDQGAL